MGSFEHVCEVIDVISIRACIGWDLLVEALYLLNFSRQLMACLHDRCLRGTDGSSVEGHNGRHM